MATLQGVDDPTAAAANLAPSFINPDYATPEQVAYLRQMGNQLMQPQPVAHWAQGAAEIANALAGTYLNSKANAEQKAALATSARQSSPLIAALLGGSSFGGQAPSSAPATAPPDTMSAPMAPVAPVSSRPIASGPVTPSTPVSALPGDIVAETAAAADPARAQQAVSRLAVSSGPASTMPSPSAPTAAASGPQAIPPGTYPIKDFVHGQVQNIGFTTPDGQSHFFGNGEGIQSGAPASTVGSGSGPQSPPASAQAPSSPYGSLPGASQPQNPAGGLGGMSPQQIAALIANPWVPDSTKQLAMALIEPKIIQGPLGSTFLYRMGQQPQLLMQGGEKGTIKLPGGMEVPTLTTGTPANPETKMLIPGGGGTDGVVPGGSAPAPGSATAGPLGALAPIATQGARLASQQKGFEDEGAKTADLLSKYKDAGIEARGQMNQIDALSDLGDRVGYGITPIVQEKLGQFGINTKGLTDIQAYESVVNNLIPNLRPPGSGTLKDSEMEAFKNAVGGLMTTPDGRHIIAQNLKLMAQYKANIASIANDTSLAQDDRMAKIEALRPPRLVLSAGEGKAPASAQSPSGPNTNADLISQARDAIARGAPRDAVIDRLRQRGIDPGGL